MEEKQIVAAFCEAVNRIKRTGFSADAVDPDWHLGGDFGIDSVELLEVWIDLEQKLDFKILDEHKRDIYTLGDVIEIVVGLRMMQMAS